MRTGAGIDTTCGVVQTTGPRDARSSPAFAQAPTAPQTVVPRAASVRPGNPPRLRRMPPPPARGAGARRALALAFWAGMAASIAMWWLNTPAGSVDGVGAALTEAGRVTGMVAGYLLLVQILLMTRVGWLDRIVSANDIVALHRDLGGLLVVAVLTHVACIVVGYARLDGTISLGGETLAILSGYPDMLSAFIATGLLVAVGLLAIRALRTRLPYEIWLRLHLASYGVLVLGYGHQFSTGRDLAEPGWARTLWLGFYLFVIACFVWGRMIAPARLNLRHRLRVVEVVPEGPDMFSIYVGGRRLEELNARAGHFFRWRFMTRQNWTQAHPFSLSAAPNERWLRLTVKAVGEHTEQLRWLRPGVRVVADGPSGAFTADQRTRHRALLIAGGSGVAPIRALLEELPRGTVVVYRASSPADLVFRREFDWFAESRDAVIHYVVGGRDDPGPRTVMSPRGFRRLVPDVSRRDVYLCGPEGLVTAAVKLLRRLHVPRRQIHLDPFEF
jgi:predicted ferric reductase